MWDKLIFSGKWKYYLVKFKYFWLCSCVGLNEVNTFHYHWYYSIVIVVVVNRTQAVLIIKLWTSFSSPALTHSKTMINGTRTAFIKSHPRPSCLSRTMVTHNGVDFSVHHPYCLAHSDTLGIAIPWCVSQPHKTASSMALVSLMCTAWNWSLLQQLEIGFSLLRGWCVLVHHECGR